MLIYFATVIPLLILYCHSLYMVFKGTKLIKEQNDLLEEQGKALAERRRTVMSLERKCTELLSANVAKEDAVKVLREEIQRYRTVELNNNYDDLRVRYGYLRDACKQLQRQIRDSLFGANGKAPTVIIKGPVTIDTIDAE